MYTQTASFRVNLARFPIPGLPQWPPQGRTALTLSLNTGITFARSDFSDIAPSFTSLGTRGVRQAGVRVERSFVHPARVDVEEPRIADRAEHYFEAAAASPKSARPSVSSALVLAPCSLS